MDKRVKDLPGKRIAGSGVRMYESSTLNRERKTSGRPDNGRSLKVIDSTISGRKISGKMKKKKRRKKIIKFFLFLIIVSGLFAGLFWAFKTPALGISNISVAGAISCLPEEIIEASGIEIGSNILNILFSDLSEAKKNIMNSFGYIDNVKINVKLNRSLIFEVTERVPEAKVFLDNATFYIDKNKVLYQNPSYSGDDNDLIEIRGLDITGGAEAEDLNINNARKLEAWNRLVSEIERVDISRGTSLGEHITAIDLSLADLPEVTVDSRIVVNMGGFEDYDIKIPMLMEAIKLNLANQKGYFNFTDSRTGHFIPD